MKHIEAIILSMTPQERKRPELLNGSRRARISRGSGRPVAGDQPAARAVQGDAEVHEADEGPAGHDAPRRASEDALRRRRSCRSGGRRKTHVAGASGSRPAVTCGRSGGGTGAVSIVRATEPRPQRAARRWTPPFDRSGDSMALKIRLRRMGRKKAPTYRIVVAESSMPRDGRFVANLGHYNPRTEPITPGRRPREGAAAGWRKGATPTDTAPLAPEEAPASSSRPERRSRRWWRR